MVAVCGAAAASCGGSKAGPLTVGAHLETESKVIGEIVSQHIQRKLGAAITRSFDMRSTPESYQGLLLATLDVCPEDATSVVATVLKEQVDPDPTVGFVRAREEMARMARVLVLDPLGIERRYAMVMRTDEAKRRKVQTLSEAAKSADPWTLALTADFQSRRDGLSAFSTAYPLTQGSPPRILRLDEAYKSLADNAVDLVSGFITDGQLEDPAFTMLEDDRKAFVPGGVCLLARYESLDRDKGLREALTQLSGRMSTVQIRKMNHDVAVRRRPLADVALVFLNEAKL